MIDASPELVEGIVQKIKTNGMFDEMRRDCLADIDTKPAFQNLKQRVENYVNALLSTEVWTPSLNKNQLRAKVRASVMQSGMLNTGIEHILHQVVDAKMYTQFLPKISDFIAENQEDLKKEYLPEVDENQDTEDMDETIQNEEGNSPVPPTPPLPLVQDEEIPEVLNDEKLAEETAGMSGNDLMGMNQDETTEGEAPVIPESAANTLRNLIQSLMGSNITNLLSETKVEEHEAEEKEEEEEEEEINSSPHAGTSPSIDPAHIEAFTDESENSDKESENSDHENDTQAGPKTPDEESSVRTPPEKSENVAVSGESEASESICKSDKNDSSFESDPENIARHSDEGSAESNAESEKLEYISSDTSGAGKLESEIESGNNFEEEVAQIIDVNKDFDESIHEVEFIEVEEESIVVEECIVENQEQEEEEYEEVVVVDEVREEPDENLNQEVTVTSERRKRHKRHHKRRHRSSSEDSSDDSGQVQSSVESQREVESDEEEVHRSRSRKKRKKKRSKKHKRQKSKLRDGSPSESRDLRQMTSSDYFRTSLSPNQSQRRPFMPSPDSLRVDGPEKRNVKVEPVFMPQMPPRYRDPYALGPRETDNPPDRGFHRPRYSPPHPYMGQHFPQHPRYSPPYSTRPPYHGHSPPLRRFSPTFDFYRPPMRPGFDPVRPPHSPPPNRRGFSPPRGQMGRFPYPHDDRAPMLGPRIPPGPIIRHDLPPGPPMNIRRPLR